MSTIDSLETLLEDSLKDIYSAEKQITKALPKMAKAASSDALRQAFEMHLEETESQIERLEELAASLNFKLTGKKCLAMEGLIAEGKEVIDSDGDETLIDAALIMAAQKVEHYEISAYGSACAVAEKLGLSDAVEVLGAILEEESATDEKLTTLSAEEILGNYSSEEEESEEISPTNRSGKKSSKNGKESSASR